MRLSLTKGTCSKSTFFTFFNANIIHTRARCGRDRMAVGFTTNCAISAHHH